jgi:hypothetical protein
MSIDFHHEPHPHIEEHRQDQAEKACAAEAKGCLGVAWTDRLGVWLTVHVGTMSCAGLFALLGSPPPRKSRPW